MGRIWHIQTGCVNPYVWNNLAYFSLDRSISPVHTPNMSKLKQARNTRILEAWYDGATIYKLAKKYKLSWSRTKRIIQQEKERINHVCPPSKPL